MKAADTLYCIADDRSFRLLRGNAGRMEPIHAAGADDFADVSHALTEPGRNRSGGISFGHETGSADEIERPRLAKHIVAALEAEWQKGGAGRIVLVAGPKMLGVLRKAMPKALTEEIAQEIDKDLSDIPDHALAAHLAG
ncbi:host attachment protein [Tabrizicola sp.]|uniref:baeRF12 domain-containing protein n=1 Tax=Tabrizicola sp. TaxID=2005166 RepID=UPI001A6173C4|nr:host attachment protein [Tabrizicola sp.]MBL9072454.1 host attachment protein [Tabrizicola sp.]